MGVAGQDDVPERHCRASAAKAAAAKKTSRGASPRDNYPMLHSNASASRRCQQGEQ
jgi:hypothetical protein